MAGSGRSWRRRSRRMRRAGQLFYVLGALIVVAGFLIVVRPGHSSRSRAATSPTVPTPTVGTAPIPAELPTTPRDTNTPPDVTAPATIRIPASGALVPGLDVSDAEARPGDTFGVLAYSGQGGIHLGSVAGLHLYATNGGFWLPFSGSLDAVRAAFHSLKFTSDPRHTNPSLTIIVSDLGHQGRFEPRSSTRTIVIVLTPG